MKNRILALLLVVLVLLGAQVAYIRVTQLRGGVANRIVTDNGTTAQWATMSGDATILYGGAITVAKSNGNVFPVATVAGGEFWYGTGSGTLGVLAANSSATKKFLSMTSSVPAWGALSASDLPALGGDATGTLSANTVGKVQNVPVKAATPNNNDVLTYVAANTRWEPIAWSTGLPAASTAGRMVYDNGSGWSASAAGTSGQTLRMNGAVPTFNSVLTNDGTTVGVTTSGAAPAFQLQNSLAGLLYEINTAAAGPTGGAATTLMTSTNSLVTGDRLGTLNFGTFVSAVAGAFSQVSSFADGTWSVGDRPTLIRFLGTSAGSGGPSAKAEIRANGDFVTNASGSEPATTSTGVFLFVPTTNGVPTAGSANIYAGAAGIKLNRATNVLYSSIAGGVPTPITFAGQTVLSTLLLTSTGSATASSVASTIDVVFVDTSAGGTYTPTLPGASSRLGKPITIRRLSGGIANVIITRAGSDTIEGSTTLTLSSASSITLLPNGTDWVTISRSAT